MTHSTILNSINLMSWNIQGLTDNVVDDDYFVSCIESNDIVVLVETWLSDQVQIIPEKYYNYHNLRPMHARAKCPSGGISILIKHELRKCNSKMGISVVKESDCYVWLKLHSSVFNLKSDLYICACYIPPDYSTYWDQHDRDPFLLLENDIHVLSICQTLNLRILNGRTLGDLMGNYTCFQHNGRSVVDYFISDERIMNNISVMNVSQPTHLSDHAHIELMTTQQKSTSCHKTNSHKHDKGKLDYKWDKYSTDAFRETLNLPIIQIKMSRVITINKSNESS